MYYNYYDIYYDLNQYKKAILYLNEEISIRKANIIDKSSWEFLESSYKMRGYTYIMMEDWSGALKSFEAAYSAWLKSNSSKDNEYNNLIKKIKEGSIKDNLLGEIFYNIGNCYYMLGDNQKAYGYMKSSSSMGDNKASRYLKKYYNE